MLLKILFLVNTSILAVTSLNLKIGLYNYIPDLANDGLKSYKDLIKSEWDRKETGIDLDLVVSSTLYDPYGNLTKYLGDGENSFDLIETDMARKKELIGKALNLSKADVLKLIDVKNFVNASLEAVAVENDDLIGIPTFECGSFITQVQKGEEQKIYLKNTDYQSFNESLLQAKHTLVNNLACDLPSPTPKMERILGGKITDKRGWYLPFIYLDAVMDLEPSTRMDDFIKKVMAGEPDEIVIKRMKEFFGYFKNNCGQMGPSNETLNYVVERKAAYFYGFSEKLSQLMEISNDELKGFNVLSPPFNDVANTTTPLLYTDAIIINQKKYNNASEDTKKAIFDFIKFFTGNKLRTDIVMGKDLKPIRTRYLLLPNKQFYEKTTNQLYKKYYTMVLNGLSAPALNVDQREKMQIVLQSKIFPEDDLIGTGTRSNAVKIYNSICSLFIPLLIILFGGNYFY